MTQTTSLGIALRRGEPDFLRQQAAAASAAGIDSLWMADHMTGFPVDAPVYDPFSTLAALTAQAPGLHPGIAVTDTFRRHPAVLAHSAMTLQAMSGSRVKLGIGVGEAMNLDPYGIAHTRPLATLRDTIRAVRALCTSSMDAPVDLDGQGVRLEGAYLQHTPGGSSSEGPLIFIGTNGPKGRDLVGEVADGWLPIMLTPDLISQDLEGIHRVAEQHGRDPGTLRVGYHAWFGVADTTEAGFDSIKVGAKSVLLGFPSFAERLGHTISDAYDWRRLRVTSETGADVATSAADVPDDLVRDVAIYGTPEDCAAAITRFAEAGVTDLVLRTVNPVDELEDCLRAVRDLVPSLG